MLSFILVWLLIQIISLIFLPISTRIFSSLPDRGYSLNKSFSIIVFAYLSWLAVSLHLLPFTQLSIIVVGVALAIFSAANFRRNTIDHKFSPLLVEIIFFSLFLIFTYLKYRTPSIYGTEKPMDFALINGILRSKFFAPSDAWYAGETINYYYFGHYLIAFISKITTIPSRIIYNLALPLVFTLTGVNIFSIITNFVKPKKSVYPIAVLAIILILFGSNLDTTIRFLRSAISNTASTISWWNASRIIPNTITEFPYFSLLLGDVHAHVLALVFGSLFLGIGLTYFIKPSRSILFAGSLVLACLAMTNPWELPGYLLLTILLIGFSSRLIIGGICLVIFTIPFLMHFTPITPVNDPKPFISFIGNILLIGQHTTLTEFFLIWGTQLSILFSIVILLGRKILSKTNYFPLILCLTGFVLLVFCEFFYFNDFFTPPLERMNTVFKLYYQVWLILGIGVAMLLSKYLETILQNKIIVSIIFILFLGNLGYLLLATSQRFAEFPQKSWGLDGLKFMQSYDPSDLAAIDWLNQNVIGTANILESATDPSGGTSYTTVGRISAATGLPTVIGWSAVNHEGGWRNSSPEVDIRVADVRTIFESSDFSLTKSLLKKYSIKYIIVCNQERSAYPKFSSGKFSLIATEVFSLSSATIYELN